MEQWPKTNETTQMTREEALEFARSTPNAFASMKMEVSLFRDILKEIMQRLYLVDEAQKYQASMTELEKLNNIKDLVAFAEREHIFNYSLDAILEYALDTFCTERNIEII